MPEEAAANFVTRRGSQSRAFELRDPADAEVIARWAQEEILMSGWALGADEHLAGRPAMLRVPLGAGDVVLIGFRPQFRAQPRGTFKLLFNPIHDATADRPAAANTGEREARVRVGRGAP